MKLTGSAPVTIVLTVIILFLIDVINAQYVCDGRLYSSEQVENCYYMGREPVTWVQAQEQCQSRNGWLVTCVDCDSSPRLTAALLASNGLTSAWSGLHMDHRRLLYDSYSLPTFSPSTPLQPPYNLPWERNSIDQGDCVVQTYREAIPCGDDSFPPSLSELPPELTSGTTAQRRKKRQSEILCGPAAFRYSFSACTEPHDFICHIPAQDIRYEGFLLLNDNDLNEVKLFGGRGFPFSYYFSEAGSSADSIDQACERAVPGGRALRVDTEVAKFYFSRFVPSLGEYIRFLPFSLEEFQTRLFWAKRGEECVTVLLDVSSPTPRANISTWPCAAKLIAVCEVDREIQEPSIPRLEVTAIGPGIDVTEGQVSAPSSVFQMLSGLQPLLTEEDGTAGLKLTLECVVPNYSQVAGVSVYKSGVLTTPRLQEGFNQQFPDTRFEIDISINVIPDFPDNANVMDVVQTYQCETVDLDTAVRSRSKPVFITLSDYEIFSAQLDLDQAFDSALVWELFKASSTETWPLLFFEESPNQVLSEVLQRLSLAVSSSGWSTYPISFLTSHNPVLVFYIYRPVDSGIAEEIPSALAVTSLNSVDMAKNEVTEALLSAEERKYPVPEFNLTSLRVVSIAWCWPKNIVEPQTKTTYALPRTRGGTSWQSPETCARDGRAFVTVPCMGDHRIGFQWGPTTINPLCDYSNTTSGTGAKTDVSITLQKLSLVNITKVNVVETIDDTENITSIFFDVPPVTQDVSYVADILQKSSEVDTLPPTTVKKILDTVSRLSSLQRDTLEEAQNSSSALNRILKSVDELGGKLATDSINSTSLSDRIVSQDMGLEVWHLADDYDDNHIVGLTLLSDGSTEVLRSEDMVSLFSPDNLDYGGAEVAILLPREFIEAQVRNSSTKDVRLVMNVFDDATLYQRAEPTGTNRSLNSKVIAAQLLVDGVPVTDLGPDQLQIVFLPERRVPDDLRPNLTICAYWDFSANQRMGGWKTDGCRYTRLRNDRDVCVCDHLTNFAVLLSFYDQDSLDNEHQLALSIITIVGLSLSIAGLAITILSFLLIKKLRQGRPQQTLFHLALALLMAWVTFLAGVEQTSPHAGCIFVAALLHYLIMASFMWMLMEGILQYLLFVKVMNTYFTNYMIKTAIPAWGIPIIPVAIILAIDIELYDGGEDYCWMSLDAFYYGFAIPVGLIVLANIFIFIMVVISLCRRKDMSKHSSQSSNQTAVNIRASFICFCVLGLSWIFGFLAIEDARIVFQYLFCITGSLQGFIIFLMMTARDKNVRQYWKSWCCCGQASKESTYGWGSSTPGKSTSTGTK